MEVKILVIGDSCKDVYIYGDAPRQCPDAPVPVFVPTKNIISKGMSGNVYSNLVSLGVTCDLITNDDEVTKTRYVEEKTNHMIIRVDSGEEDIKRIENVEKIEYNNYDAIIISDYNKGFLTKEDILEISLKHDKTFLDTKKILGDWAKHITYIKVNEVEYERSSKFIDNKEWFHEKLIITKGSSGCVYKDKTYSVKKVEIKDLSGAGDTFLSAFAMKLLKTQDVDFSLQFANKCATSVVQKKGVAIVDSDIEKE